MSRVVRRWSWLAALAVGAGAVAISPAAVEAQEDSAGANKTLVVTDDSIIRQQHRAGPVVVNDTITYVLHDRAQQKHSFSFPDFGTADYELDPADPNKRSFQITFDKVGKFYYRCNVNGLSGFVKVEERVATTKSSTAGTAPTTTTTERPAMVNAAGSTSRPGVPASGSAAKATSTTTASTPAVPAPTIAPTSPVAPTSAAPGDAEGPLLELAGADAEEPFADPAGENNGSGGSDSTVMLILGIGLAAVLTGAAGWGWYHRASRYLPA